MLAPDFAFLLASADSGKLALELLTVFGAAKLMGEIFSRIGMPAIVGEILAGTLIGPAVLGWVQPSEIMTLMAELGVLFLLFRVGLEVKSSELMAVGGTATLVAVMGVLAPFAMGYGISRWFGEPNIESFFVAAAMVATSIGITAQVLAEGGFLRTMAAKITLGAAVIDDVLGLLVLAIVSSLAKGELNFKAIGVTALLAIGFTLLIFKWGSPAAQRVVPRVEQRLKTTEAQFSLALLLMFALAAMASFAGIAAIVGAFLAGMALSDTVSHRVHDLTHGISELMTPFFLAGVGLQMDLSPFSNSHTLLFAGVLLVAAVVSKWIGGALGAFRLGGKEANRIGVGMIPRGEVGLVVAQLGFTMGVIPKSIYGVVVFMSLATTIVAPPLLKWAYRDVQCEEPQEVFDIG
jgi:Kef-type K+ transport system membrane component KefB